MTLGYEPGLYAFSHGNVVEKKIPAMIVWSHDGTNVSVEGSWDNWTSREAMQKVGKDFTIMKVLPCGVYQFKFLVDGKWRFAADLPAVYDEMGQGRQCVRHEYDVIRKHEFACVQFSQMSER
ncbi:hypothetical protein R1flu_009077 [Riccia fluitans]|uniref:AMP-activated protein kinase glycogen-binding domain-containing protein n=1 Tax=Riccia fluitans TaxID=41844 RepID=A0ABD1Z118_9MARC